MDFIFFILAILFMCIFPISYIYLLSRGKIKSTLTPRYMESKEHDNQ